MDQPVRVEFPALDGVTLRGDFYKADGDDAPAVAMTAGLTLHERARHRDAAQRCRRPGPVPAAGASGPRTDEQERAVTGSRGN